MKVVLFSGGIDSTALLLKEAGAGIATGLTYTFKPDRHCRQEAQYDAASRISIAIRSSSGLTSKRDPGVTHEELMQSRDLGLSPKARETRLGWIPRPLYLEFDKNVPSGQDVPCLSALMILSAANWITQKYPNLREPGEIFIGGCAEDWGPDYQPEFIERMNFLLDYSEVPVKVSAPFMKVRKSEIVRALMREARRQNLPKNLLEMTYSCSRGTIPPCGECKSCVLRARAIRIVEKDHEPDHPCGGPGS